MFNKKIVSGIAAFSVLASFAAVVPNLNAATTKKALTKKVVTKATTVSKDSTKKNIKYVFYFIGDGMGISQRTIAGEYLAAKEGKTTTNPTSDALVMDSLPVHGMNTTYSLDSFVTDSAPSGTALATGHKTNNGMIGISPDGKTKYTSILEQAQKAGWATGLITTTRITHATPASFYAHIQDRDDENSIAEQLLKNGKIDYITGGGYRQFIPQNNADGTANSESKRKDNKNLLDEFRNIGYYVGDGVDLSVDPTTMAEGGKYMNLFGKDHMEYDLDNKKQPSLADMVSTGIDALDAKVDPTGEVLENIKEDGIKLDQKKGFFMAIEGGRIDHAAHGHDILGVVGDTVALDNAVKVAVDFAKEHPDETLIVVTADHETGGMGLGIGEEYALNPEVLAKATAGDNGTSTCYTIGATFEKALKADGADATKETSNLYDNMKSKLGLDYTQFTADEKATFDKAVSDTINKVEVKNGNIAGETLVGSAIAEIISKRTKIGWTTYAHTGAMVPLTAQGPGAERLGKLLDNTEVGKTIADLMGLKLN